jgi:hypothetical protein
MRASFCLASVPPPQSRPRAAFLVLLNCDVRARRKIKRKSFRSQRVERALIFRMNSHARPAEPALAHADLSLFSLHTRPADKEAVRLRTIDRV